MRLILLFCFAVFATMAFSATENVDGIVWTYTISDGAAFVGDGQKAAISTTTSGRIIIPPQLGGCVVKGLSKFAFQYCASINSVAIPATVETIGAEAFYRCSILDEVVLPEGLLEIGSYAFGECSNLTEIIIPAAVQKVDSWAFHRCSALAKVWIFGVETQVAGNTDWSSSAAFMECSAIEDIVVPGNFRVSKVFPHAYKTIRKAKIVDGATSLVNYVFYYCASLESLEIPSSVVEADDVCDYNCSSLKDLTMPGQFRVDDLVEASVSKHLTKLTVSSGTTQICDFYASICYEIEEVVIPASVSMISTKSFYNSSRLKKITIPGRFRLSSIFTSSYASCLEIVVPEGESKISANAFQGCLSLQKVSLPTGITTVEPCAFSGCSALEGVPLPIGLMSIATSAFKDCTGLTAIEIPASVNSMGASAFYGCTSLESIILPTSITAIPDAAFQNCSKLNKVSIPYGVQRIGSFAFSGCRNLQDVTFPTSLSSIGSNAFSQCSKLSILNLLAGLSFVGDSAFKGCMAMISMVIPDGTTEIGAEAFNGCVNLTSITIPSSVKKIGSGACRGCVALFEIEISDSVTELGDNMFYGCTSLKSVKLPKCLASLGMGVCFGCSALETIELPNTVKTIGADAYNGCSNVIELNIPDGVTSIGNTAFKDCTELRKVSIPDSVTAIGNSTFAGCANVRTVSMPTRFRMSTIFPSSYTAITTVTMPEGTTKVADDAYYGCAGLTSVALPSCVTAIGNNAFRGCTALASVAFPAGLLTIGEYAYYGCSGLSSVEIPQSVTQVGVNAFGGCNGITSVTVPECVTSIKTTFPNAYQQITNVRLTRTRESIPSNMFNGCAALASIIFPSGVSSIGASAFSGCVGLSEVVIPASVKEIGENAFLNCTSLETVSIPSSVEVLGATAFKGCSAIKTVVLERADKPLKVMFPDAYRTIENLTVNELTIEAADFFEGCESLVDVDVPEDCELYSWTFKESRFDGDWWIENGWVLGYAGEMGTSFVLPDELTKFGGGAFDGNEEIEEVSFGKDTEVAGGFSNCPELQIVNFGGGERRIGAYAFWGDTYLDNVTIPAPVEEIGKEAFLNCSYIQDLTFEGGVRDIGAGAFSNCASLISLELKDGGKRIGENAFYGCWRLMSVKLPLSLEQVGDNAFVGLKNLTGVTVPTHVKTMKEIFPDRYSAIKTVVIPEGETDIIDGMFDGCSSMTSVVIPNSVTNVGARAFGGCSSLVELGLPDGVRRIGASALTGCGKIKDFTMPKNLEAVGDAAFSSCSLLTTMVIPETVTQIGAGIAPYSLRSLYFLGDAPVCVGNPLNGTYSGLTVYVVRGTKGWDGVATSRVLPETWNGRAITSWTPNQFDVVFDANGGEPETYTVQEITDNSYAFPKAVPTMTGYDFAGWWTESEGGAEVKTYTKVTATKSHTLYAHWKLRDDVVIVNFNANGGTITPMSKVYVVGYPFVDLPVPTRRGYRFAGWRSETGAAVSEKMIATAQMSTLVASWTANGYTVVYHSNDGEDAQVSQSLAYGVEATLRRNTFTRKDHAFVGWATVADGDKVYDDAEAVVNLAEVDGSVIHLYAVWIRTVVNYAVRFDGNGGGGSMGNENFTEGEVKCLTSNAFVRAGFIFVGWSLVPDGEVVYEDGEEVSNLPFGTDNTLSLYAVWVAEDEFIVSKPVVNVPQDGTFDTETFLVALSCATKGAEIYYSTNGRTPRVSELSRYSQPFEIEDTTTIIAVAVRYGKLSAYTEVTVTKVDPVVLTLDTSLDEPKLKGVTTGGDADWTAVREEFARVGGACAKSGSVGMDQRTWLEATVSGKGELTFYWRVSCEHDGRGTYSYDHLVFTARDARKEFKIDGVTDWIQQKVTFGTEGEHTVRWEYVTDDWEGPGFADCGWVDGVVWTPSAVPTVKPTIEGDEEATVTGDAETGFVVKPSEGKTAVEVTIPQGVDAAKVTVEVSPKVASVKPNGARVKIVSAGADITEFLNVPAADGNGVVDLTKATVKEEIVREVLDPKKGAVIDLCSGSQGAASPTITTAPTRVGLFYQLREGETLGGMKNGDSKVGDGEAWSPEITVKGGNSAFYSIGVGKGE